MSAQDRLADLKTAEEVSTPKAQDNRIEHGERAGWLTPIPLEAKRQTVRAKKTVRRATVTVLQRHIGSAMGCAPQPGASPSIALL